MLGNPVAIIDTRDGEGGDIEVDTIEENYHNLIENEGINRLINDTFVATDGNAAIDEIYENIHDVPPIDKAKKSLYKYSKTSLLSALLLLVNLKVMNGISNTAMTYFLRYAIFFYIFSIVCNLFMSILVYRPVLLIFLSFHFFL